MEENRDAKKPNEVELINNCAMDSKNLGQPPCNTNLQDNPWPCDNINVQDNSWPPWPRDNINVQDNPWPVDQTVTTGNLEKEQVNGGSMRRRKWVLFTRNYGDGQTKLKMIKAEIIKNEQGEIIGFVRVRKTKTISNPKPCCDHPNHGHGHDCNIHVDYISHLVCNLLADIRKRKSSDENLDDAKIRVPKRGGSSNYGDPGSACIEQNHMEEVSRQLANMGIEDDNGLKRMMEKMKSSLRIDGGSNGN